MGILDGRVALITGAARGQGRAHALALAREGADIVALDIADQIDTVPFPMATLEDLEETERLVKDLGRRVIAVQADVRSQEQLDAAVARGLSELGSIDICIANAGIWQLAPIWEMTEQQWLDVHDVNLNGVFRTIRAVSKPMIDARRGAIVVTASMNGEQPGLHYSHYTSSKAGVIGLMKGAALDLSQYGIRCNAISPGIVDTPMLNWQGAYDMYAGHPGGTRQHLLDASKHDHALAGVAAIPAEAMAEAALWLASDASAYITGVALPVDAGHMLLRGHNFNPA
ncbi:NAD(P)-dependent oxidoreductase [Rhodococcus sp. WS1]|uniref:mycofactocin-coupled SDR family oxidoreductase n=1 Tax=unclassified Rhodococcus (in: high G+C Gram-positive bacteria) TaxID=192944 RepID=UPI0011444094|nr:MULTISPECIES: mycofactocin-coupled SDR family oxidoreductase [unclassified Rhodococcus (in: high G+C Gram-positive bacteria)]ROZ52924.1 NAD(P)-dependent oxidoreductase [Rhodococcus sp. WS1]TQC36016.1 NAD(P)-dependent oxidoreductase [Rhodococcus sp. WS7]